jgi:HEPN domain-containing protein
MTNRYRDWYRQALSDLKHSLESRDAEDYNWACFAAQQAAEKAVKALVEFSLGKSMEHSITKLMEGLKEKYKIPNECFDDARYLDKFYIPTRYPYAFDSGAPVDYYTPKMVKPLISRNRSNTYKAVRLLPSRKG